MSDLRVVAISDTHGMHRKVDVPDGDILIHCGDLTGHGTWAEAKDFMEWFESQPHKHKVFTAGNHDRVFQQQPGAMKELARMHGLHLLLDEEVELGGLRIYGSPWTPQFFNWSFMKERGGEIRKVWKKIPDALDILITHGPPYGHGDLAPGDRLAGCLELLNWVRKVRPELHLFGHIHEGHGVTTSDEIHTIFGNAAICTGDYRPVNEPLEFTLEAK